MRYILFLLFTALQLPLFSQVVVNDANGVLDKALMSLKADLPVRMDYCYEMRDGNRELLQGDRGIIYIDNNRYALFMQDMKVWCDGATQWSFMREIDEVYITDAASEEAQNLSPLYVMEHYREGYSASAVSKNGFVTVKLQAVGENNGVESVELCLSEKNSRLLAMIINMPGQGCVEVKLDGYVAKCGVADEIFVCPLAEYANAEIIDMR